RFGSLAGTDVRHGSDKFDVARCIRYGMRGSMDMLDRSVGHQQSISVREVLSVTGCALDGLFHARTIIWMNALKDRGVLDGGGLVVAKYSECFLRPDEFAAGDAPAEAAGAAQSLGFGQIHFTLAQRIFGQLAFRDVLACDQDDQLIIEPPHGLGVFTNPERRTVLANLADLPIVGLADIFQAYGNVAPGCMLLFGGKDFQHGLPE